MPDHGQTGGSRPAAEPFNFHNDPTYHWYVFVRGGGAGSVRQLVLDAMDATEAASEMDLAPGLCYAARDALARKLETVFEELTGAMLDNGFLGDIWCAELGEVDPTCEGAEATLIAPLFIWAARQIWHDVVAVALLRDEGKWSPERSPPEIV